MNNRFLDTYGFWPIELLVAVGVVFGVVYRCRAIPDAPIARLMHHRDRIWFPLLLLFLPAMLSRFVLFHLLLRQVTQESYTRAQIIIVVFNVFYGVACGAAYGMAGCCIASPAKKEERISGWIALMVSVVLMILISGLLMLISAFRVVPVANVPILLAAVVVLAFLLSRAFVGKKPELPQAGVANDTPDEKEYNPAFAFLWLLVGLAPIPILLILVSSKAPSPAEGMSIFGLCVICNLLGGLGSLRGIKNKAVRIVLGIFLGAVFFVLSCIIAIFQACSGHVGM